MLSLSVSRVKAETGQKQTNVVNMNRENVSGDMHLSPSSLLRFLLLLLSFFRDISLSPMTIGV